MDVTAIRFNFLLLVTCMPTRSASVTNNNISLVHLICLIQPARSQYWLPEMLTEDIDCRQHLATVVGESRDTSFDVGTA